MTQENETNTNVDLEAPNLGALFKKYASNEVEESPKKESEIKQTEIEKQPEKKKEKLELKEEDIEEKSVESSVDWKSKYEELERNHKETRKWGDDKSRKLSAYQKAVEKFKEEGNLSEEEADLLLDYTKHEALPEKGKSFIDKAAEVWDREIENIRKYSDYPELDRHLHAFQHFLHNGTQEEVNEAYEDIKDLIDSNPILFTKKMLEIGKRYHDEVFGDLIEAGNLKNFKRNMQNKVESLQKENEKLKNTISKLKDKYEGYDENPNYRMPQGGDGGGKGIDPDMVKKPGSLIEKFNQGKYQLPS